VRSAKKGGGFDLVRVPLGKVRVDRGQVVPPFRIKPEEKRHRNIGVGLERFRNSSAVDRSLDGPRFSRTEKVNRRIGMLPSPDKGRPLANVLLAGFNQRDEARYHPKKFRTPARYRIRELQRRRPNGEHSGVADCPSQYFFVKICRRRRVVCPEIAPHAAKNRAVLLSGYVRGQSWSAHDRVRGLPSLLFRRRP